MFSKGCTAFLNVSNILNYSYQGQVTFSIACPKCRNGPWCHPKQAKSWPVRIGKVNLLVEHRKEGPKEGSEKPEWDITMSHDYADEVSASRSASVHFHSGRTDPSFPFRVRTMIGKSVYHCVVLEEADRSCFWQGLVVL
jgi:hypothetical protein